VGVLTNSIIVEQLSVNTHHLILMAQTAVSQFLVVFLVGRVRWKMTYIYVLLGRVYKHCLLQKLLIYKVIRCIKRVKCNVGIFISLQVFRLTGFECDIIEKIVSSME